MASSMRDAILDNVVQTLQTISGEPNYFYTLASGSVSRVLTTVERVIVFPALFVTEGTENRRWETVGPQILSNILEIVIWGYARADGAVALDSAHARQALIHDVDVALAAAFTTNQLGGTVVDVLPSGSSMTLETDEGLAAVMGGSDVGVFRMRIPVLYRQTWGQP